MLCQLNTMLSVVVSTLAKLITAALLGVFENLPQLQVTMRSSILYRNIGRHHGPVQHGGVFLT